MRTNKKFLPTNLREDKDLKGGDSDYRISKNDDIVVYKWMNNKAVHVISNFHDTETTKIKQRNKDGTIALISSLQAVNYYNTYMGKIDKVDMFCSLYSTSLKSKKWWHRILFDIIDLTVCNACILYKILTNEKIDLLDFPRPVAQPMITKSKIPKRGRLSIQSNQLTAKKRRKSNYSVSASIRKENLGIHWHENDLKCSKKKQEAKPFIKRSACKVHLCINDKEIVSTNNTNDIVEIYRHYAEHVNIYFL